jgi:hypothetical protein
MVRVAPSLLAPYACKFGRPPSSQAETTQLARRQMISKQSEREVGANACSMTPAAYKQIKQMLSLHSGARSELT